MEEFLSTSTISNNDLKVQCLNVSHDGQFVAALSDDDLSKKYHVEIYEVGEDLGLSHAPTLYSYSSSNGKFCLAWHPKRNILAFAGEEKGEGTIHLLQPVV